MCPKLGRADDGVTATPEDSVRSGEEPRPAWGMQSTARWLQETSSIGGWTGAADGPAAILKNVELVASFLRLG